MKGTVAGCTPVKILSVGVHLVSSTKGWTPLSLLVFGGIAYPSARVETRFLLL